MSECLKWAARTSAQPLPQILFSIAAKMRLVPLNYCNNEKITETPERKNDHLVFPQRLFKTPQPKNLRSCATSTMSATHDPSQPFAGAASA
jgi:hypothetical protein